MTFPIRHALMIVNPASRRGGRARKKAFETFSKTGVSLDVRLTEGPGHAAQIAAEVGSNYDAVFTLGGDGTAMEAIGALSGSGPPIGILPGGTGNVIVRSLGIPLRVTRAIPALLSGTEARIDLGRMSDGRRFAIGVGVGIDATMIAETPAALKQRIGILAYVLVGIRSILRFESYMLRLTVDGHTTERPASAVLIANFGTLLHDLITLGDGIRIDDGLLNACVFSPGGLRDAIRITWRLMRRDFRPDPCLYYESGTSFRIETDPPRHAQADGELVGNTPLEVVVEPLAGRILLPRKSA